MVTSHDLDQIDVDRLGAACAADVRTGDGAVVKDRSIDVRVQRTSRRWPAVHSPKKVWRGVEEGWIAGGGRGGKGGKGVVGKGGGGGGGWGGEEGGEEGEKVWWGGIRRLRQTKNRKPLSSACICRQIRISMTRLAAPAASSQRAIFLPPLSSANDHSSASRGRVHHHCRYRASSISRDGAGVADRRA